MDPNSFLCSCVLLLILNFYTLLMFKNRRRWYCEGKCIRKFLHARAEQSHARILDQLQKLGTLEFRNLSFQIKVPHTARTNESAYCCLCALSSPNYSCFPFFPIAKIKCKCSSHYNSIIQDTSKDFKL